MLKLKGITKSYRAGDQTVLALKNVSIEFRKNEFVSILGPSGCGKTTILNVIGGLDRYDSGILYINKKSTRKFTDKDWDDYRNTTVGFVFQSYNLISHQTALSNVELALTLSGVSKQERKKRAIAALESVGLADQIHKKPNQMSGGQMQRVAIARALVNDPDILLADEPTGALDSETSVQIMEILKEISKEKLVIMVTHNPELAQEYSTRTVKLLDGEIVDDSMPYVTEEILDTNVQKQNKESRKDKKARKKRSMGMLTAFSLSLNNLLTKKTRTILTSFAGSIGIIGIALIMSLSNGIQLYIDRVQADALSSYPLTIESETVDISGLIESSVGDSDKTDDHPRDKIYSDSVMLDLINTMVSQVKVNNLQEFKKFIENDAEINEHASSIHYAYDINLNIYSSDTTNGAVQLNPSRMFEKIYGEGMQSNVHTNQFDVWREMLSDKQLLDSQYDVIAGQWPKEFNEIVLVVDENNEVNDFSLFSLGLKDPADVDKIFNAVKNNEPFENEAVSFTYDDILNTTFKLVLPTEYYSFDSKSGLWIDNTENAIHLKSIVDKGIDIKISGIIRPSEDATSTFMNPGTVGYTQSLTEYVINAVNESDIVKQQKANSQVNVLTGFNFVNDDAQVTIEQVKAYVSTLPASQQEQINAYMSNMSQEQIIQTFTSQIKQQNNNATYEDNLKAFGVAELDTPAAINIYAKSFNEKEKIADIIDNYNKRVTKQGKDELVINYTDYFAVFMSSVSTIIDVISYVLIAFVSISLVVSSIMIGIITYISVLERTKEIGILRSIGASKKDISRVFNAETVIVGFVAGAIGIGLTMLLNIPVTMIIQSLADITATSKLPTGGAIILVVISVVLTLIAGLIP
ncbi:MAG: ABC transporter ATP-binding protein/permease, partial [bacterium]|nr:ABC transporter ATP-binding protein/permease [bacterium]